MTYPPILLPVSMKLSHYFWKSIISCWFWFSIIFLINLQTFEMTFQNWTIFVKICKLWYINVILKVPKICSTCRILKITTVSEFTARIRAVFSNSVNIFKILQVEQILSTFKITLIDHNFQILTKIVQFWNVISKVYKLIKKICEKQNQEGISDF